MPRFRMRPLGASIILEPVLPDLPLVLAPQEEPWRRRERQNVSVTASFGSQPTTVGGLTMSISSVGDKVLTMSALLSTSRSGLGEVDVARTVVVAVSHP